MAQGSPSFDVYHRYLISFAAMCCRLSFLCYYQVRRGYLLVLGMPAVFQMVDVTVFKMVDVNDFKMVDMNAFKIVDVNVLMEISTVYCANSSLMPDFFHDFCPSRPYLEASSRLQFFFITDSSKQT